MAFDCKHAGSKRHKRNLQQEATCPGERGMQEGKCLGSKEAYMRQNIHIRKRHTWGKMSRFERGIHEVKKCKSKDTKRELFALESKEVIWGFVPCACYQGGSLLRASYGSNGSCERQSLQEALCASGFEGGFKSKRRMYPSCIWRRFQIQTKDAPKLAIEGGFKFKKKDIPKLHSKEVSNPNEGCT